MAQTVADFWQMIWEQGCVVIVMLSRLQDNGYQLCHRYWPEEGSEQYHIFEVKNKKFTQDFEYAIFKLRINLEEMIFF